MSFDLLKFDLANVDLTKIDLKQIANIKVISITFLVIVGITDICLVFPLTKKIEKAKNEQLQQAQEIGAASQLLFKEGSLARAQLMPLEKYDELSDRLAELAKQHGLEVKIPANLSLDKADTKDKKYIRRQLRIEAAGGFKDLGLFLTAVHRMPEAILEVDTMAVSRNVKDPALVQANINFILYALKDEENPV